jgi:hypothetical protein
VNHASRPYCWDNSLAIFEPSLLFLSNTFTDQEWFPRYINISIFAVEKYGTCILEKNESLILDWLRHYFFSRNSTNLLLKETADSDDQLQRFEKYIDTFVQNPDWIKCAINDILSGTTQTCLGTAWISILKGNDIDLLPFSFLLDRVVSAKVASVDIRPLLDMALDRIRGTLSPLR